MMRAHMLLIIRISNVYEINVVFTVYFPLAYEPRAGDYHQTRF